MGKLKLILILTLLSHIPIIKPSAAFICALWIRSEEKYKPKALEKKQERESTYQDSTIAHEQLFFPDNEDQEDTAKN